MTTICESLVYANKLASKTMSKILSPKMCEVILTKWYQSLHQWTHNVGYANQLVKSQHTLSTRTCECNSIE